MKYVIFLIGIVLLAVTLIYRPYDIHGKSSEITDLRYEDTDIFETEKVFGYATDVSETIWAFSDTRARESFTEANGNSVGSYHRVVIASELNKFFLGIELAIISFLSIGGILIAKNNVP